MYVLFDICFLNKSVEHTFSITANLLDQHKMKILDCRLKLKGVMWDLGLIYFVVELNIILSSLIISDSVYFKWVI